MLCEVTSSGVQTLINQRRKQWFESRPDIEMPFLLRMLEIEKRPFLFRLSRKVLATHERTWGRLFSTDRARTNQINASVQSRFITYYVLSMLDR